MPINDLQPTTLPIIPKRSKREWPITSVKIAPEVMEGMERLAAEMQVSRADIIAFSCQRFVEDMAS